MAKEVCLNMWVSIVPTVMYNSWVKRKFIPRGAWDICETDSGECVGWTDVMDKDGKRKSIHDPVLAKAMKKDGWKLVYERYNVKTEIYDIIHKEVSFWYKDVFAYVDAWLKKHKFIDLEKGSFDGGFCAVPVEDETTKAWGGPLARKDNKVVQIKEKFGRITVYFGGLTEQERKKINRFANAVEKKFDCITTFI